ncbi:tail fiber protein [Aliivibrio sp. S4TY2]|uniref:tail fiber protein n=1 Tax=unclassified Aliivibrio TaxID=2645654 RepID=UPI00237849A8|nr:MULTISPECIES: tail fiber protein [unclassified Aliivibrio]MDD9157005.1 tail fiber protein [Aliivibrio sp. S4TY2]MDD9160781.1 tail fiber protein [Aliivibrio sp. S4TY1]MDD9164810.1 tail fiber protein [Aliivibrio sp. S4MY2]MDD9168915.1 tail fiber protein [Aliivibrio sp. S4MY4]MDD9185443.1 tail fiber protein [Aliivibrio sp. S4MY3]
MSTEYLNYITLAGLDEEALAKEEGRKVTIKKVVIGLGLLSDTKQPQHQAALLQSKAEAVCFVKAIDTERGFYRVEADIPIPDTGYHYFEIGTLTDTGVLYSYARSRGDYVAGKVDSDGKLTRIRLNFRTNNSELMTITQDDSVLYTPITDFDAHVVEFNAHCEADNPHPQYLHNDEHATKVQAEEMTSTAVWISALRWKEAFLSRLSHSFTRARAGYAVSEKALSNGLETKANSSHKHDASDVNSGILAIERLPNASTEAKGAVQLNDTVTSTSTTQALTANKGTTIWDRANDAFRVARSKWTYVEASLTAYGATKLSSAINSTSQSLAATSKAVKLVADIANSKVTKEQGDSWYWKRDETVTNSSRLNNKINTTMATSNTIATRDSSGDISARLFRSNYANERTISGGLAFRNSTSDNYIRFCNNLTEIREWLSVFSKADGDRRYVLKSSIGGVETYVMARTLGERTYFGEIQQGSGLVPTNAWGYDNGGTLQGTWQCMGVTSDLLTNDNYSPQTTLWLRIS